MFCSTICLYVVFIFDNFMFAEKLICLYFSLMLRFCCVVAQHWISRHRISSDGNQDSPLCVFHQPIYSLFPVFAFRRSPFSGLPKETQKRKKPSSGGTSINRTHTKNTPRFCLFSQMPDQVTPHTASWRRISIRKATHRWFSEEARRFVADLERNRVEHMQKWAKNGGMFLGRVP